jgi:hypothetical protein
MQIFLGKISKIKLNNGISLLAKRNESRFLFSPRFEELLVVIFVLEIIREISRQPISGEGLFAKVQSIEKFS